MSIGLIAALLTSLTALLIAGFGLALVEQRASRSRLQRLGVLSPPREAGRGFSLRAVGGRVLVQVGARIVESTGKGWVATQRRRLAVMGAIGPQDVAYLFGAKILLAVICPLALLMLTLVAGNVRFTTILVMVLAMLFGSFVPDAIVLMMGRARQRALAHSLPFLTDMLALGLGAGMNFEAAINLAAQNMPGPLSEELRRFQTDLKLGIPRREAFENIIRRTSVPDLNELVRVIQQAEELGTSIVPVISAQAVLLRTLRRQRARAAAQRAPITMIIPLVLFILPVLLIMVLGPAVLRTMTLLQRVGG
jgi:tight adherence protein C